MTARGLTAPGDLVTVAGSGRTAAPLAADAGGRDCAPVFPGDTVRMELTVAEKEARPNARRGWIRFDAAVKNQRDEIVIDGEWLTLMLRRRPAPRKPPAQRT